MFRYPKNLYTDVRIESKAITNIALENGRLVRNKTKTEKGAMIRIYDGEKWYYNAVTDIVNIQRSIDELACLAKPKAGIYECPEIKKLEVNQEKLIRYEKDSVENIENSKKLALAKGYYELAKGNEKIKYIWSFYNDCRKIMHFISSKGSDVMYDKQNIDAGIFFTVIDGDIPTEGIKILNGVYFHDILGREHEIEEDIHKTLHYAEHSVPIIAGDYPCILSPALSGVFAHESFGHKSEADFMMNDEAMKKEWTIGKKVGVDNLSIVDGGDGEYFGYTPYDDEGCKSRDTYLIKEGILCGRLHDSKTAACMGEELTGNARAINFQFEPIVRMTNTYIERGNVSKEELFEGIREGVYLETWKHGSGMSTFTIAPARAYMIREGNIAEPVRISVVTGNVMDTLYLIDGISKEIEMNIGWCGKNEQGGLPVGQGGPYIRVKKLRVQ